MKASAATVADAEPSKNPLVNEIIDLIMAMPANGTLAQFNQSLANMVATPGAAPVVFTNLIEALRQISKETVAMETGRLSQPPSAVSHSTWYSLQDFGSFYGNVQEERLFTVAFGGNHLATVMAQMSALSESEFAVFEENYVRVLRETSADLEKLKSLLGARKFVASELNLTYGSRMLLTMFESPNYYTKFGGEYSPAARLQRERVIALMRKALSESTVFRDQESRILETARRIVGRRSSPQESAQDRAFAKEEKAWVEPLITLISSAAARRCSTLFESVPTTPYRMPQWP